MDTRLYLVCESCHSRLYEIDKNKLRGPFLASMLLPVLGIGVCWQPSSGQDEMVCPGCHDFVAKKWNTIITTVGDSGIFDITELEVPVVKQLEDGMAECPICGAVKNKRGIKTHILYCKGKQT